MTAFEVGVIDNLRKIMINKNLTQAAMARYLDTSPWQFSKILTGTVHLSLKQISNLATALSMDEIDILTYPDRYVKKEPSDEPVEAVLQIKLKKDKKDQVLKLVFGENNIEILNK